MRKILLVIFDGIADLPVPELDGKTPLEVAKTPNLDKLATKGVAGTHNAMDPKEYPTSEEAHFEILGYNHKKDLPGRGVLEALGVGARVEKGDLALRANFATVDDSLKVIDPRSGNIKETKSFARQIAEEKLGLFTFRLYSSLAHRAVLLISGAPVSKEVRHHSTVVTDTDPHKAANHRGGDEVLRPRPVTDTIEAKMTANALWDYQLLTHRKLDNYIENRVRRRQGLLAANFLLTRGAGFLKEVQSFYEKFGLNAACIAGAPLYKGIASYFKMDVIDVPGSTGDVDSDVEAEVQEAINLLHSGYDFVFLHIKGADIVAEEEGDFLAKLKFFEKADKAFAQLLKFDGVICVTGDHATPCVLSDHSADPVPIMIIGGEADEINSFSEKSAARGSLGHLKGKEIMPRLLKEGGYV